MDNPKKKMLQEMIKHSNHKDVQDELRKMDMGAKVDALTVAVIDTRLDIADIKGDIKVVKTHLKWHRDIIFALIGFLCALALVVAGAIVSVGGL